MRILIVCGSSGGHIFPALALMEELAIVPSNRLHLILPRDNAINNTRIPPGKVSYISGAKLSLKFNKKNIKAFFSLLRGAWEAFKIIVNFKPDVVVGFGSLNTLAPVFFAWLFRIKTVIHEQNVIPGRANCLLSRLVDKIAVSFEETKKYLSASDKKIIVTGNPLRKNLAPLTKKEAIDFFRFKENIFTILVTGGSQGSKKINTVFWQTIISFLYRQIQVIHITGNSDFITLKKKYGAADFNHKVYDFFSPMEYAYSAADLVVCRAGATTVAELIRFQKPAVLIPYPYAYQHQQANARILKNKNTAVIIKDEDLTVEKLSQVLEGFISDPDKIKIMKNAYGNLKNPDACLLLANAVQN